MGKKNKIKSVEAPWVETDIAELGDGRLNPEEAIAQEREKGLKAASVFKIPGQDELSNPDRSSGPRIHWRELWRRLERMNSKLKAQDSRVYGNDTVALYFPKTDAEKINDGSFVALASTDKEKFHRDHKYVGGFDKTYLPFYSHVQLDTSLLPTREIRGVMSVLLMLLRAKIITLEQVKQEFSDPAGDKRGERFLSQAVQ